MHKNNQVINKYLSNYSEPAVLESLHIFERPYQYVLVIPAFLEGDDFLENVFGLNKDVKQKSLLIIVVNEPEEAKPEACNHNKALIEKLKKIGRLKSQSFHNALIEMSNLDLFIVGPIKLSKKAGVGHARKIGADIALRLIEAGIIATPIIYGSDADARLPRDYFIRTEFGYQNNKTAAFIYPFRHQKPENKRQEQAIRLYDLRLQQYVQGLDSAGSPYAFHTIASTIAVSAHHYAMVRGWPKLSAGEDFYFLNKLKKTGAIKTLEGEPIELSARLSVRVPFGTGPALIKMLDYKDLEDAPIFYHPQVFDHLRDFLHQHVGLIMSGKDIGPEFFRQNLYAPKDAQEILNNLSRRKSIKDRARAFHDWFDGFKTLKFIHHLKDGQGLTMQSYKSLTATK